MQTSVQQPVQQQPHSLQKCSSPCRVFATSFFRFLLFGFFFILFSMLIKVESRLQLIRHAITKTINIKQLHDQHLNQSNLLTTITNKKTKFHKSVLPLLYLKCDFLFHFFLTAFKMLAWFVWRSTQVRMSLMECIIFVNLSWKDYRYTSVTALNELNEFLKQNWTNIHSSVELNQRYSCFTNSIS